jgi:hypothetical protein
VNQIVFTTVMIRPGEYEVRANGENVGQFSMLEKVPSTGRSLYPAVSAGQVASALTDLHHTVVDVDARHREKGWVSSAAYHEQVEAIRELTSRLPDDLAVQARDDLAAALERHGWSKPLTPEQMSAWQDEVLQVLAALEVLATLGDVEPAA